MQSLRARVIDTCDRASGREQNNQFCADLTAEDVEFLGYESVSLHLIIVDIRRTRPVKGRTDGIGGAAALDRPRDRRK